MWMKAAGTDVPQMVQMAQQHFEQEIDQIFTPEPVVYARHLTRAVVEQFYQPGSELLTVKYQGDQLQAYLWATSGHTNVWSDDRVLDVRMIHLALDLSPRVRIQLINEMLDQLDLFAYHYRIPIICSSTVRSDQTAFLKIHQRRGYLVRGSTAWKRL